MVLRGPEGMLRLEPRSAVYKAGTLPAPFVGVSLSLCVLDLELFPFYYWEKGETRFLEVLKGPCGMPGIEPGSVVCKPYVLTKHFSS